MNSRIIYLVLLTFLFTANSYGQQLLDTAFARLGVQECSYNSYKAYYDRSGRLIKHVYANTFIEDYSYNENGKLRTLIYTTLYHKKRQNVTKMEYIYDDNGVNTSINHSYSEIYKDSTQEGKWTETFTYDSNGFLIQSDLFRNPFHEQKIYINGTDNLADTVETWNNIISQPHVNPVYGDTMQLVIAVACFYNKVGKLVSQITLNAGNTEYAIEDTYEYDQYGNLIKEINKSGGYMTFDVLKFSNITVLNRKYDGNQLIESTYEIQMPNYSMKTSSIFQYNSNGLLRRIKSITISSSKKQKRFVETNNFKFKYVYFKPT